MVAMRAHDLGIPVVHLGEELPGAVRTSPVTPLSMCFGSGSCTRMPWMAGSALRRSTRASSFGGRLSARPVTKSARTGQNTGTSRMNRLPVVSASNDPLRIPAGKPATQNGYWFTPAKQDSRRYFKQGDVFPDIEGSSYGATFWQWSPDQSAPSL